MSHDEQCDVIMSAFEVFKVAKNQVATNTASTWWTASSRTSGRGVFPMEGSIRHNLCLYVGVSSMSRLVAVHGMSKHTMKNYCELLQSYWSFMRSELEEALSGGHNISQTRQGVPHSVLGAPQGHREHDILRDRLVRKPRECAHVCCCGVVCEN
ncbi:hypothetical protein CAPTEDRAFT_217944 [Capitella teleta]|uniref:Uncharacterized protein n=1 Tax=Capitella teleta TaxID=283909 RepID=R7UYB9_CAPTE|nr:hypothetical protein CAPTEDRAFT_217944 [Capitella teleta]|eukprot:ELU08426.1 hypothetical protein CAPTEDRAFT_217944 [Capitella teleta]